MEVAENTRIIASPSNLSVSKRRKRQSHFHDTSSALGAPFIFPSPRLRERATSDAGDITLKTLDVHASPGDATRTTGHVQSST